MTPEAATPLLPTPAQELKAAMGPQQAGLRRAAFQRAIRQAEVRLFLVIAGSLAPVFAGLALTEIAASLSATPPMHGPVWLVCLFGLGLATVVIIGSAWEHALTALRSTLSTRVCRACMDDCTGTQQGRCPECGKALPSSNRGATP